jgi:hypothetical protein
MARRLGRLSVGGNGWSSHPSGNRGKPDEKPLGSEPAGRLVLIAGYPPPDGSKLAETSGRRSGGIATGR